MTAGSASHRPSRVTIRDIAQRAGVSRSTVSRALSGTGYVASEVKARVRRIAGDLDYVPDLVARDLKTQSSRTIGVIISDLRDPFYSTLAYGIGAAAQKAGYTMTLIDNRGSPQYATAAVDSLLAVRASGLILTPISSEATQAAIGRGMAVVEVDRQYSAGVVDGVVVDNIEGGRLAGDHLVSLGHRRIALLVDETDWDTGRGRSLGFRLALDERGIQVDPDFTIHCSWGVSNAHRAATELLTGPYRPTAVFAVNSVITEGLWRAATDLYLRIPQDLSVVGFDDVGWMTMVSPQVTSVAQDIEAMGTTAVEQLLRRIGESDAPCRTIMLPVALAARGSSGPFPTE